MNILKLYFNKIKYSAINLFLREKKIDDKINKISREIFYMRYGW